MVETKRQETVEKGQMFEDVNKENSRQVLLWFADISAKTLFFSQYYGSDPWEA